MGPKHTVPLGWGAQVGWIGGVPYPQELEGGACRQPPGAPRFGGGNDPPPEPPPASNGCECCSQGSLEVKAGIGITLLLA